MLGVRHTKRTSKSVSVVFKVGLNVLERWGTVGKKESE